METIIVTGVAGFIGSHLAEKLLREGCHVIGIDNFNDFYDPAIKKGNVVAVGEMAKGCKSQFTFFEGDILDYDLLEEIFNNHEIDAVIHLAAYAGVRPSLDHPQLFLSVNVNGTANILEQMKAHQIRRLVFASSSSVYGNSRKVPFSEQDPIDQAISPYAVSKRTGEMLCYTYHHLYKMSIACLRYFTVYGARQRPDLAIHKFSKLIVANQPVPMYGDGSMCRDYTYIDDIVDGTSKALLWTKNDHLYDIFNLGKGSTVRLDELIRLIAEALQIDPIINKMPEQPGDVKRTYADIAHAQAVLGYQPRTEIQEGIKRFVEWYRHQR